MFDKESRDLDILIRFPTPESCQPCGSDPEEVLATMSHYLQSNLIASPGTVNTLPSSQFPLLKFSSCFANLSVDVAVKITNSWPTSEWVNAISYASDWHSCLPALGTFTLIMKLFLRNKKLSGVYNGGVGGYALMVYVRSYLKVPIWLKFLVLILE
jgi:DNA polymerase sigma